MVHSRVFQQICLEPIVLFFLTFSILEAPPPPSSTSYGATEVPANRTLLRRRVTGPEAGKLVALHRSWDESDDVVMVFESAPPRGGVTRGYPPVSSNVAAGCQGNHEKSSEKMEV